MEIRKIALSLVAAMALGTTAVQAQCTNNCKKSTTTKAKIGTTVNRFEKDLKCDEAKVKTAAHKAGCAFKRDAKKVGAAVKRDEVKVGKAVKKTYTKAKNALKKQK